MEYEKIKQLMEDMGNSKLSSIDIDFPDGTKISMKKQEVQEVQVVKVDSKVEEKVIKVADNVNKSDEQTEENSGNIVKSPMVGTFYSKPSPNESPFVEVGMKVKKGDVLCIIEAMKLMNEIESEFDGEIKEIFVSDGEIVDFGKPLFKIS